MNYELKVCNLSLASYAPACSKQVLIPLRIKVLKKVFRCLKMQIDSQCFGLVFGLLVWGFFQKLNIGHSHSLKARGAACLLPIPLQPSAKKCYMPHCTHKFLQQFYQPGSYYFTQSPGSIPSQCPGSVRPSHINHLDVWVYIPTLEPGSPRTCTV